MKVRLVRPLYKSFMDDQPYCLSELHVDPPEEIVNILPEMHKAQGQGFDEEWEKFFSWVGNKYPGWIPQGMTVE